MKEVYQSGGCGDNFISYICNSRCCNICSDSDAGRQVPGSGRADSYWGKNKGRSMEGALEKFTKYGAMAFMLITIAMNVILKAQGA